MEGIVVKIGIDQGGGPVLGAKIGSLTFPIPSHDGDIRKLQPGQKIDFMTTREGTADIIKPEPQIRHERER